MIEGLLFLPPLLMFTTIGNLSLHHAYLKKFPHRRMLLASSTILGALFAYSNFSTPAIQHIVVNFAAGVLLFIIVREALPQPKEGKTGMFILGIVFYTLFMYAMTNFF